MKICGLAVKQIAHFDGHNYLHMNHMNADYCILLIYLRRILSRGLFNLGDSHYIDQLTHVQRRN